MLSPKIELTEWMVTLATLGGVEMSEKYAPGPPPSWSRTLTTPPTTIVVQTTQSYRENNVPQCRMVM